MTAALALEGGEFEPTSTGALKDRRWPSWPPPAAIAYASAGIVEGDVDDEANLRFAAPDGAYAAVPAWRSRAHYLAGLRWHPRLAQVCRQCEVAVETFLAVMALYAARADNGTGRNIAVANRAIAQLAGVSDRHVRNATRAARELGVLQVVLAGAEMSIGQRCQVLDQYRRGHPCRRWRNLPNYAAATVPAELTRALHRPLRQLRARLDAGARAAAAAARRWRASRLFRTGPFARRLNAAAPGRPVDNATFRDGVQRAFFHLPHSGSSPSETQPYPLYEQPLFQPGCGQTPAQRAEQQRTAATRPPHRRRTARRRRPLDPELARFVTALKAALPLRSGQAELWIRIPPHRLAQALHRHWRGGLTVEDIVAAMTTHLRATGRGWYLDWRPGDETDQARYLVKLVTDAVQAGMLIPLPAWRR